MKSHHFKSLTLGVAALALCAAPIASAASHHASDFPNIGYATWQDDEPQYRIYPGDEIEITVPSAPELSKTITVQPDGRISLPLIDPVMAADRTSLELSDALTQAYASQLIRPDVTVAVKTATPLRIFVGGEVDKPGVYDMPGDINTLQAVIQAGGFKTSAYREKVIVIRRGTDGRPMLRTVNLRKGINDPARTDLVPLRRFDVVYVPRSTLADVGVIVGQLRDLMPGSLAFSYILNGNVAIAK